MRIMAINPVLVLRRFRVGEIKWETAETFSLVLVPEDLKDIPAFKAGQWMYLHLLHEDGSTWAKSAYSVAVAPEECAEKIELGIKLRGEFTKRASKLMPDDVVAVQGPFGVFTLPLGQAPLVMFAGGIGITPLRSMIQEVKHQQAQGGERKVTLFYSNKYVEDAPYLEELMDLAKEVSWFTLIPILTQHAPTDWKGEQGRLNLEMLKKYPVIDSDFIYLMCGPKPFMESVRGFLKEAGVDVRRQLKEELFGT